MGNLQAQRIRIKSARRLQIGHAIFDMRKSYDIERWIEIRFWNGHGSASEFWNVVGHSCKSDIFGFHVEVEGPVATITSNTR